ncbi:MAG TPA: MBL fold metallo-hydrolase [Dehalococcoidia bacterium]|nr:MBL fold metallo-hydrolase [Dehalococcoidia bacterium]
MKITVVYDNEVREKGLRADWGFSCLVEAEGMPQILFDTGTSGDILLHNMQLLGINTNVIGIIVISHDHFDHTGGLSHILEKNKSAAIYVPASFSKHIPGRNVTPVKEPIPICDNVYTTGQLKGIEQSLVLNTRSGIVLVVGCSHPGVGEIIDAASSYGKVNGIIGGFHEFRDLDRLHGLSLICPCHCTQHAAEIKRRFPEQCLECGAGLVLEL